MPSADMLQTYRQMLATTAAEKIHWWYMGTLYVEIDGYPSFPVAHAETLMVYDTLTISPESFSIVWNEIGYFRDCASGEVIESWRNPITGESVTAPKLFVEGPATYTISKVANQLSVKLVQPNAVIAGVDLTMANVGNRVWITQVERKRRGLPRPDGTLPETGGAQTADAVTTLVFSADAASLKSAQPSVPCLGYYEFQLGSLADWLGFGGRQGRTTVKGVIVKCGRQEVINRQASERLRGMFPAFFNDHA